VPETLKEFSVAPEMSMRRPTHASHPARTGIAMNSGVMMRLIAANDSVERRGDALSLNEPDLSTSSTFS
jgi:hypothetical protein